ncbi:polysaccharide deacetylase family protein [Paenibacillus agricola]|uniref:Polysaccharide deacetylase family protein n=1 Tax=Paenibacillus agricola TaxID=2716264 RepID=A0ABX0JAC9_9BACL|nr:polysaccharide deacetylase family protein [Paenibacillus agricola]NHN32236.1 polysaccharide deacetylase family protein [Paenibacillus agricola]
MTNRASIALTFDDGPDPTHTPLLLNVLKQHKAQATFFLVGKQLEQYPDIAKQIITEGHEIGNHTYSHPNLRKLDYQQIYEELYIMDLMIRTVTGQSPTLFRPPYLYYNDNVLKAAKKLGYEMILRSIETFDYRNPGVRKIIKSVLGNLKHGDIVLMHDAGGNRMDTITAVEKILIECQKKDYQFVKVSKLLHK